MIKFLVSILVFILIWACGPKKNDIIRPQEKPYYESLKNFKSDIGLSYYTHYVNVIKKSDGYRPPISARALSYLGLAVYESVVPGMEKHQSIASKINGLNLPKINSDKTYHWGIVANTAYNASMLYFLANTNREQDMSNDSIMAVYNKKYFTECDTATQNRSIKFAKEICYQVYLYSLTDGQANAHKNNKPTDYMPPVGDGLWKSTAPDFLRALTPRWGGVRTFFAPVSTNNYKDPIAFSNEKSSMFYKDAVEVYEAVKNKTNESVWIAEFWSDDLNNYTVDAAARWLNIANNYMAENKVDLETAITVNAKLGIGLHDASVNCWHEKYTYNLLRPVSYINKNIDANWASILRDPTKPVGQQIGVTPQHPSYPSGHAVFGALAAEIMISSFGDKINFTDRTHEKETYFNGKPRTFTSFTQMANENAFSRIPLGVHYRMDCVEGLRLGYLVGKKINKSGWELFI